MHGFILMAVFDVTSLHYVYHVNIPRGEGD